MSILSKILRPRITKVKQNDQHLACPNCQHDKWVEGPQGGAAQNIQCGNCKKWYNYLGPFGLHEIKK